MYVRPSGWRCVCVLSGAVMKSTRCFCRGCVVLSPFYEILMTNSGLKDTPLFLHPLADLQTFTELSCKAAQQCKHTFFLIIFKNHANGTYRGKKAKEYMMEFQSLSVCFFRRLPVCQSETGRESSTELAGFTFSSRTVS